MNREMRVRLGAGVVLIAAFAGGVAVGFALDRGVSPSAPEGQASETTHRSDPSPSNGWIIDRLEMTAEQRARVDSVVEHYGAHMTELQKDYRPRFRAVVDSTERALRELLDDAQLAQYDSLEAELRQRRPRGAPARSR